MFRMDNMFKRMKFDKIGYWDPKNENKIMSKIAKIMYKLLLNEYFDNWKWRWFLWVALAVNIIEAVVFDFIDGNIANGIVGILIICAMPRPYFSFCKSDIDRKVFFFTFLKKRFY